MKEFVYTITDASGIHVRPAGKLVQQAQAFASEITVDSGGKKADLKKLFSLMALAVKQGDSITVTAAGEDEGRAIEAIEAFLVRNL